MATTDPHPGENEDDLVDYGLDDDPSQSGHDGSLADPKLGQSLPMQKRRRVGRACDECRRKKIKCDGKQPCTHCTVYSYGAPYSSLKPLYMSDLSNRVYVRSTVQPPSQPCPAVCRGSRSPYAQGRGHYSNPPP
jgi:Fungal Zn(2)-Cys(6) binuclear cluster domain.